MSAFDLRIGHGFDSHRIEAGEGVTLGGVFIACKYKMIAHSDGDVLIHALCDALLGAIGAGDIGKLFPDNDPQFKGIDSRRLLRIVMQRVRDAGFAPVNIDCTLVAEAPRIGPHVPAMCEVLAADLAMARTVVNVKATTNEGMGHLGRKEGIAAHAVVLLAASARNG